MSSASNVAPAPCPRRAGTTAIASSGVSSSTNPRPGWSRGEEAHPGGADAVHALLGDEREVAGAAPALHVARERILGLEGVVRAPVERVDEHVAQEPDVLDVALADRSLDLLGELDPVAVRVEDVEQPHLAVQLEHDADLDPASRSRCASAFTSSTSTSRRRLPPPARPRRSRSPCRSARASPSGRPSRRTPRSKPSVLRVEDARRLEVADAVPDDHAEDRHSVSPGSSRKLLHVAEELGAGRAVDRAVVAR